MYVSINKTSIQGVMLLQPKVHEDDRGWFFELSSSKDLDFLSLTRPFVQDNESYSRNDVLRGIHFQLEHPQAKLVRVIAGVIWNVVVDIRITSPTFGCWEGFSLTGYDPTILCTPEGCANGFITTSAYSRVLYKCTDYYHPNDQKGVNWQDPDLGITWANYCSPENIKMSDQDKKWPTLKETKQELLAHAEKFTKQLMLPQLCSKALV